VGRREPWSDQKARIWETLARERDVGYLDPGIEGIVEKLNSVEKIVTTSTCIGRIAFIEGVKPWERAGEEAARIIHKTHHPIDTDILERMIGAPYCNVWMRVSGPIIHVRTPNIDCASHLMGIARRYGFKHSGIIAINPSAGYAVELMSGVQYTFPLKLNCALTVSLNRRTLDAIVGHANKTMEEARAGLADLADALIHDPGPCA